MKISRGLKYSFITAAISGISIYANGLFVSRINPLTFIFYRNLAVIILMGLLMFVFGKSGMVLKDIKSNWRKLLIVGLIGGGIPFGLFFLGLSQTGSNWANALNKTIFLWVGFLAIGIFKDKLKSWYIVGYIIMILNIFLSVTGANLKSTGTLMVLSATLLWSLEYILSKIILKTVNPWSLSWARIAFGLPFLSLFLISKKANLFDLQISDVSALLFSSLFLIIYMLSWYSALKYEKVQRVALVLTLAPLVTFMLNSFTHSSIALRHQFIPLFLNAVVVLGLIFADSISRRYESNKT